MIDDIASAITSVEGAQLLDRSSDLDHNRTVLTFVGPPEAVSEAAFRAIGRAAALINMDRHTGEHPRIGSTDVVPFVPLSGISMDECVAMARDLGKRVGEELQIPVYLYEHAAMRPERVNLEHHRRGQYETLKIEIERDPGRKPDFGPPRLGPAGATVIGARNPLIAFNVYLTTSQVDVAKKIARAIRQSSGGLRFVKALGLLVDGKAQVSINLTNYQESPIGRVVELIRREATRYGVAIHHSELVGLIPEEALLDAAVWYTQLEGFSPEQVLEVRLRQAQSSNAALAQEGASFLDQVAAASATPGGGSVAAQAGAMGAALVEMVAGLTMGKAKYQKVEAEMLEIRAEARQLRVELSQAARDDAAAYEAVMGAYRLAKETDADRQRRETAIQRAMIEAARVPLGTALNGLRVLELAAKCVRDANVNAISDALTAAAMGRAAVTAAAYNVRINLYGFPDGGVTGKMLRDIKEIEARAASLDSEIGSSAQTRAKLA